MLDRSASKTQRGSGAPIMPSVLALLVSSAPLVGGVSNGFTFVCNPEGNFGCDVWRE